MNYYEHHIGDYDADTAHLSWVEDMAYTRLMRLYYRREKPIPADINEACRLVRATTREQKQAVESVLREFFTQEDDGWHQARCNSEIAVYQKRVEHNRRVGKKGGRPRKVETQKEPAKNPPGSFREPEQNPPQTPDSIPIAKAIGGLAPPSAKDRVWAIGPAVLGDTGAVRSLLGQLLRAHGEAIVAEALDACVDAAPGGDRKAWVIAACRSAAKRGVNLGDVAPKWATDAGFANRFEAENDGCFEHNAAEFRDGKRVVAA